MPQKKVLYLFIILAMISLAMHFPHLSKELMGKHVWRQTQTQSTINSFVHEDMNIFHPRRNDRGAGDGIFRMEFPLMQWLVAIIYKIFGDHIIITRLCMWLIGVFSVGGMYCLLLKLLGKRSVATMGAWAFNFSPAFFYYTINPLPDNLSLCCAIWGIVFFLKWIQEDERWSALLLCSLFFSVSALCKLPFILYFSIPMVYLFTSGYKNEYTRKIGLQLLPIAIFGLLPLIWYAIVVPQWKGNGIVGGMLHNASSQSMIFEFIKYHLLTTLPDLLLNYGSLLFFLSGFFFFFKYKKYTHPLFIAIFVWCMLIVAYFLFEINMIEKVHDYYLFPFMPALFILVGYGIKHFVEISKASLYFTLLLLLILPLTAFLRTKNSWNPDEPGFNKDLLIYKNELRNAVPSKALCIAGKDISHFIDLYYIDKKGWTFDGDHLPADTLKSRIRQGAQYLYSDAPSVNNDSLLQPYFDKLVMQKGTVKIYHLSLPH